MHEKTEFDFSGLRKRCQQKLEELGFQEGEAWRNMIDVSIESAYGGLLLCLIPNLIRLHLEIAFIRRNPGNWQDSITSLFGPSDTPEAFFRTIEHI